VGNREIPILCYVTDRRGFPTRAAASGVPAIFGAASARLVEKIAAIAAAGVDWVQIREKDLAAKQLAALTQDAIARTREVGPTSATRSARVIVNDRVDVAIAEGAGGVHLGEAGLPVADVLRWVERSVANGAVCDRTDNQTVVSQFLSGSTSDFLIGASCHSFEGARAAVRGGANYIFFGPVFATPSKARFGEPQGVKNLASVCGAVDVPVIAIGGITLENAGECIAAGAAGIAAIRLFQDAADPAQIVSTLKKLRR
jgi:thiamine monophosphate synthase